MLCPSCEVDMLVGPSHNELLTRDPPAAELVQTLFCPRCGRSAERRFPLELREPQTRKEE